jgi:hypothetical protein
MQNSLEKPVTLSIRFINLSVKPPIFGVARPLIIKSPLGNNQKSLSLR